MEKGCVVAVIFIVFCTISDVRTGKIPVLVILVFGLASVWLLITGNTGSWREILYALVPGMALLALSLCTGESIGYGDGLTVLVLGLLVGIMRCTAAVFTGFLLSAVWGLVLLVLNKANGKSRMPWIPFLAAGLGVTLFGTI